ncbi:ribosome maturation factor RimM [Leucobacter sp. M11]|uniref:ribosome maturation factor RimM n=1 Tax=Leucobacter sp. M11 TaxID=2993565 RepID=UPI002D80FD48|nr:ribosome maturation factor RimM [Leucobacter sp. M11]MEB4613251.1 ribosome maturation factor RimM [Leucobacter sp. M11]
MTAPKSPRGVELPGQLRVGRLTKPHGLKGALKLELFTDSPDERFTPGSVFSLQVPSESPWSGKTLTVRELKWFNGSPVGFFDEVPDRNAAESIAKAILWIDADAVASSVEEDAWYQHELRGLNVVRDGAVIGTVREVQHLPAQDLIVVATPAGDVLLPFVQELVPEVDPVAGHIVITPPPGLFEEIEETEEEPAPEALAAAEASAGIETVIVEDEDEPAADAAALDAPAANPEDAPRAD